MWTRSAGLLVSAALLIGLAGCEKSSPKGSGGGAQPNSVPIASVHWLGAKQVAADPTAAHLVQISRMPETRKLVEQTLDKLALAPWRSQFKGVDWQTTTNYAPLVSQNANARILKTLLEDILASESHIHTRTSGKEAAEFAIAIRLDAARIGIWKSNVTTLATSKGSFLSAAKISQSGPWLIVTSARADGALLGVLKASLAAPAQPKWLTSSIDFGALLKALKAHNEKLSNLPRAVIEIAGGAKGGVRTRATLQFPKPLQVELEPWIVPTNLIADPLVGFSAGRGLRPLLQSTFWNEQKLGVAPNQVYFWAQKGMPWFHYFAFPSKNPDDQMKRIGKWIEGDLNPAFEEYKLGTLVQASGANRFTWKGIPIFLPNIGVETGPGTPFIAGGFFSSPPRTKPMPAELIQQVRSGTNVVWYDWEITGACAEGWMGISQISKHTLGYARLTHTPAFDWLGTVRTNLGNCTTIAKKEAPAKLSIARDSALSLNAAELILLVDWLESPDFPAGLHTLRAPRPAPIAKAAGNWSAVAAPSNAPTPSQPTNIPSRQPKR